MAYIARHKDGWRAQVAKMGVRKSATFVTKTEARDWAHRLEAEIASGKLANGAFTFGQAVAKYKADVSVKKDGKRWEWLRLDGMLRQFGDVPLTDIQAPRIAQWRDDRLREVSASTVVREANLLRNLFNLAKKEWHWCEHYPFDGVRMPAENAPRQTLWGWREIRRVLRAPRAGKTAQMQDAFHIALRTGMRLGEVLAAPSRYDPARRVVTLEDVAGARKTDSTYRIPIGRKAHKLLLRAPFTITANEGSVLFSKLCRELLISGLTFHDARATALTHMARKMDILTLARISRHKDLKLLLSTYYRETPEQIAARI